MATLRNYSAFVVRGIRAFVNLEVGVTRDQGPIHGSHAEHAQADLHKLEQARIRLEKRNRQLEQRSRQLAGGILDTLQHRQQPGEQELSESQVGSPTDSEVDEDQRYGRGLRPGDPHYRAYVGPPEDYDLVSAIQVTLLLAAGLRETHRVADVGCGSLRGGRLLIPYLRSGHYFGVEPNRWLVEEGIERELGDDVVRLKKPSFRFVDDFSLGAFGVDFDFAVAQSIFSHTYPDLTLAGLQGIAGALAPKGKLFATFVEREGNTEGSGWLYPGLVPYTWKKIRDLVEESGLVARRLNWMHPRQSWFVAAHPDTESEIDDLSRRLRPPLQPLETGAPVADELDA